MNDTTRIHVGLIGCGYISQISHLPAIKAVPETTLIATSDISEDRARQSAEKWGAKAYYADHMKMLERDDIDAVVIASPNYLHHKMTIEAAEAGKHVLCEKPIACTKREADEMVEACKRAGVKFQVGQNHRFWPQNEIAKQLIDGGTIGDVMACRSTFRETWKGYPERIAFTKYRYVPAQAGAFTLMDLAIHRVDLIRWLVGDVKRVFGVAKHTVSPSEVTALEDNVWIFCEFENGGYGCVDADRFSVAMSNATELHGTEGNMYLSSETFNPFQSAPLAIYSEKISELPEIVLKYALLPFWEKPRPGWITVYPPREDPYIKQLKHFARCIMENRVPLVSGEEGSKSLEVVLAVFKSMEKETWVDLPLKGDVIPPGYRPSYERSSS